MSHLVRRPSGPEPRVLDGGDAVARIRAWPGEPGAVSLIVLDRADPSPATVHAWLEQLRSEGVTTVRTGALGPSVQPAFTANGFEVIQDLALLTHSLRNVPAPTGPTPKRLRVGRRLVEVAHVDQRSFDAPWGLDVVGIVDACRATPEFRLRVLEHRRMVVAYAITGQAGTNAYLQRLAVDPSAQGRGLGRILTIDALRWAQGRRCTTMLVNTHTGNAPALSLYRSVGFEELRYGLVVMGRRLA